MKNAILVIVLLLTFSNLQAQDTKKSDIPVVTIKDIDGKPFSTAELKNEGKPMIVDFWATWCKPCVASLNGMNENYAQWQEETGVKIYAISIDDTRTMSSVAPFVAGKGWEFDIFLDSNSDFRRAMNVNNVPHTFLIDGQGKIVSQRNTYAPGDEEKMYEELKKLSGK
ncbi:MAG: TlpA family protein disulfide reductase [Bacteroidetes bacterium]|jgi:cytochrome c biogenesis protein CcmG/thiol:disulfide interchange protein DsbE|nr:TlpA family protein disulfide reductase [Bacteroidota bacterium]MBK9318413.1 TlpA family protein disulfide reductase [Bacteroidota bacterium]